MTILLATGSDRKYLPRIWPYFESIERHSQADRNVVFVPVQGDERWFERVRSLPHIEWRPVPIQKLRAKNPNNCLQHGEFLEFDDPNAQDDDIVIFTDGDIELQRWFSDAELARLEMLPANGVAVAHNEGSWGSLLREIQLLQPKTDLARIKIAFPGDWDAMPCFNTGVLIARRSAYRALCEAYVERFAEIDALLGHYAKQQWLLSWLLSTGDFAVRILPGEMHTHGCHPLPLACTRQGDDLFFEGKTVMFRHNVEFGPKKERTGVFRHHIYGRQPVAPGAMAPYGGSPLTGAETAEIRATVIVHSHNDFTRLAVCLKSVLPTLSALDELLIVDEGSTDQSADLLLQIESSDPRIRVLRAKRGSGRSACWNQGAEVANGRIFVFSESDVQAPAGWLDALTAHFEAPNTGAVGPLWDRAEGPQSFHAHVLPSLSGEFSFDQFANLIAELNVGMSFGVKRLESFCLAVSRSAFTEIGGWDASLELEIAALDLSWRLQLASKKLRVAADVVLRDTNPTTAAISESAARAFWKKIAAHFDGRPPLPVEIWGAEVLGCLEESPCLAKAAA
jgi:hypothetical protein